jgi:hypothetical protein
MGKSATFENDLMKLIFWGDEIVGLAQNDGSPVTQLYVSLHTADPSQGDQTANEVQSGQYGGYARVAVARSSSGWNIVENAVSPVDAIVFPACTGGSLGNVAFVGVGLEASGAGLLLYSGQLNPYITLAIGVQPQLTTGSTITEA